MERFDEYSREVRGAVCAGCIDSDSHGICRLGGTEQCAITTYSSRLIETVLSVESDSLQPYVAALRRNVCASCKEQSGDGTCALREHVDCALDRYFPEVVNTIEKTRYSLTTPAGVFEERE